MGRERWKSMKIPKLPAKPKLINLRQVNKLKLLRLKPAAKLDDQKLHDDVVIYIEKMLEQKPQVNAKCNIYQVTKVLCEMNPKVYVPQFISIGPFHHGTRKDLIVNEQYKLYGFINFLRRINIESIVEGGISETAISLNNMLKTGTLKALVDKAHGWMKETLNCYATPINMEEKFIIMMLVDACFIVEFFILKVDECHPNCRFNLIKGNVDFSFYDGIEVDIADDMVKLENQVPFSLLENLFEEIPKNNVPIRSKFRDEKESPISNVPISFKDLARWALKSWSVTECEIDLNREPDHLVDFLIGYFEPFPAKNMQNNINNNCLSFLGHIPFSGCWQKLDEENNDQTKNNDCLTLFKPLCHLWNKIASKKKKK